MLKPKNRIFIRKTLRDGKIPFDLFVEEKLNKDTLEARKEAKEISRDPSVKAYTDVEEMVKDINS